MWSTSRKSDAWEGKPKAPPEHDTEAASMYELGYSEGEIKTSVVKLTREDDSLN
ncbi:hypothetical protein [Nostoc sp. MS1]|uniref:hypothetical protein n=1 Tax=Nostoc sp. MS1 TaxID=2764711 RepID=UPI001CC62730|nr:hypothetical protein [Nostoc sp. MS1]BCL39742.1 hypothetical protein NSMS1_61890 [Nostoc sp. MS1]